MTGTNHVLTGTAIGLAVANPMVAIPAAFMSHFVCDIIPHFGVDDEQMKSKAFSRFLIAEAVISTSIIIALLAYRPEQWFVAAICGFLAFLPDAIWIRKYRTLKAGESFSYTWLEGLLHNIQWYERPKGAFVELAWLLVMTTVIFRIV